MYCFFPALCLSLGFSLGTLLVGSSIPSVICILHISFQGMCHAVVLTSSLCHNFKHLMFMLSFLDFIYFIMSKSLLLWMFASTGIWALCNSVLFVTLITSSLIMSLVFYIVIYSFTISSVIYSIHKIGLSIVYHTLYINIHLH